MGKNIIPGIAKMLGVKIGEEFKVDSLYEQMIFKFADNELLGRIDVEGSIWTPTYVVLSNLLGATWKLLNCRGSLKSMIFIGHLRQHI